MGLSITGYVLEPPRVGDANSPFTFTPDNLVSDQGAFDTAYPSDETEPRSEYMVFVEVDGDLADARFGWTKNEGEVVGLAQVPFQRFDYDGLDNRFKPLTGGPLEVAGTLELDANTTRLSVTTPLITDVSGFPVRVSIGTDSGVSFTTDLVSLDTELNSPDPPAGTVQISQESGQLGWAPADLTTFEGQTVRFQRQRFFTTDEGSGQLGIEGDPIVGTIDDLLLLNPKPAAGQFPQIRIGFGGVLTPIEVATEGAFTSPASGSFEWALDTGRLNFNATDVSTNTGSLVFYDGVLLGTDLAVTTISIGTVGSPGTLFPLPDEESDVFFRVVGTVQFGTTEFVDAFSANGKTGIVEVRRSDGQVQFSAADQTVYGLLSVEAVLPDLEIENGITLRLFRSPVDVRATDPDIKDVSAFHERSATANSPATLADPIIAFPTVSLPAVPIDSASFPVEVEVAQGAGSFTGILDRLDVPSPSVGKGYIIDFVERTLAFAERKELVTITPVEDFGAVTLDDPLVFLSNLSIELDTGTGFVGLVLGEDFLFDTGSGTISFTETSGILAASGSGAEFAGTTFTDTSAMWEDTTPPLPVAPEDLLIVTSGASAGVYTVASVTDDENLETDLAGLGSPESNLIYEIRRDKEVLADRFFLEVIPVDPNTAVSRLVSRGPATNSPRISIPIPSIPTSRIRFGKTTFATLVTVATDGAFTSPPAGTVEVSLDTGNLNFSVSDLGTTVYWARELVLSVDYTLQPFLGFISFTERMLENEEAVVTYKNTGDDPNDPSDDTIITDERGGFLVRKEESQPHPTPTNTVTFNPLGREVADVPVPRVFRGGRPQGSDQVSVDTATSTVTFIGAPTVTDALPSGPTIDPSERILIDYHVHEAIGGEQDLTIVQPPMAGVNISIEAETDRFTIAGDQTGIFKALHLLRVEGDATDVFLIDSATFNGTNTEVVLTSPQVFLSDVLNPKLLVSSGLTRTSASFPFSSYFEVEAASYTITPRGSNKVRIPEDLTRVYQAGRILFFSDGGSVFEFYLVEGSTFDEDTGLTEVTIASNTLRQYDPSSVTLRRSVRPVLEASATVVQTAKPPLLTEPFLVYRRVEGEVGQILVQPDDYKIDNSGRVELSTPLLPNEEVVILSTGSLIIPAGSSVRASYTFGFAPSVDNGLLNQILLISYTTFIPDSFFYRVETMTNFRGELAQQFREEAQATIPSGGPRLENSSSPRLFEQGRESIFFPAGRLANEDIVARATLLFFNDAVNFVEDALQDMDGRVVGDRDGRLLFDGLIDNPVRASFADATNQIDDLISIFPSPFNFFVFEAYKQAQTSRFFPTLRSAFTEVETDPALVETGTPIADLGVTNLTKASSVRRRTPWAVITVDALTGETTVTVDAADGDDVLFRPDFDFTGNLSGGTIEATIADSTTVYEASIDITSRTGVSITFTGGLSGDVPAGATVFVVAGAFDDGTDGHQKGYRFGIDLDVDLENGLLTDEDEKPPYDGTVPGLETSNPVVGERLDAALFPSPLNTAPERFPGLDGGTTDDDGNRGLPILNPTTVSESAPAPGPSALAPSLRDKLGFLAQEKAVLGTSPIGTLRTETDAPFEGVGSLDAGRTIITLDAGTFPVPVPKEYDLVRILDGTAEPSTPTNYHRIAAGGVTANSVMIEGANPFTTQDSGFTFSVSTSTSVFTGLGITISGGTTVTRGAGDFVADGVKPGQTVVVTAGVSLAERRQVVTVSALSLTVSAAFTTNGGATIRVDKSLNTYGGSTSIIGVDLTPALDGQLDILDTNSRAGPPYNWSTDPAFSEKLALEGFFDTVFQDITTGITGSTTISVATFTAIGDTFLTDGVDTSHFLFIRSGSVANIYQIGSVTGENTLNITGAGSPFPASASGITYRIVKATSVSIETLQAIFAVLQAVDTAITDVTTFRLLALTLVPVVDDSFATATGLLETDLDAREPVIDARITDLDVDTATGSVATLQDHIASVARLYDSRFTWIDARINRETGILVKKDRALEDQESARQDIINSLTKLLTTEP